MALPLFLMDQDKRFEVSLSSFLRFIGEVFIPESFFSDENSQFDEKIDHEHTESTLFESENESQKIEPVPQ